MATKYPLSLVVQAIDKSTAGLRSIKSRALKITQPIRVPLLRLGNSLSSLAQEAGFPRLLEGFRGFGSAVGKVKDEAFALGRRLLAIAGIGGAVFFGLVHGAVEAGDKLAEMADRVSFSVDSFAQLQFAAAQADVDQEQFNSSLDQFNRRLGEAKAGGGALLGFLRKVSPALALQVRGAKNTEEAFGLMAKAFVAVKDPARRAALASAAFGKGGLQMGQFLGQGPEQIAALRQRFVELSGSQEKFARGAGDLDNAMRESQVALLGLRNAVAAELFPALAEVAKVVTKLISGNRESLAGWARKAGEALSTWVKGGGVQRLVTGLQRLLDISGRILDTLGGWPAALAAVAVVMAGPLLAALAGLISSVVTLGVAIGATPVGWILLGLTAVAAAAVLLWKNFDTVKAVVGPALAPLGAALSALWAQLKRLWAILEPVLMPALRLLGKVLGAVVLVQLRGLVQLLTTAAEGAGVLVGWFVDLVEWAGRVGQAMASGFKVAGEALRPVAGILSKLPGLSQVGAVARAGSEVLGRGAALGPVGLALGAASALPQAASTEARVSVDFANLPRGARVEDDPAGTAPLDLSLGYSMLTP